VKEFARKKEETEKNKAAPKWIGHMYLRLDCWDKIGEKIS
jgi:hypothetical protein